MSMDTLSRFALPVGAFMATLLSWAVFIIFQRIFRSRKSATGASDAHIGVAHQSLLEGVAMQVRAALGSVVATPIVLSAAYIIALGSPAVGVGRDAMALFFAGGLALWGYGIYRWRSAVGRQKYLQWHFAAKEMVDRAMAGLVQRDYVVIRNFEKDQIKIDYLIISPKGVFTMQTVVYPIPSQKDQPADAMVTYDGRTLFFPNEKDHLSIATVQANTELFSEWLSDQLGAPIAARAIVVLPGWQVKRISAEGISVIQPGQVEALFQYVKARPLSVESIHQIEQHIQRNQAGPQNTQSRSDMQETTGSYY